jgi:hypothetical protein
MTKMLAPASDIFAGVLEAMENPLDHMKHHVDAGSAGFPEGKSEGGTKHDDGKVDFTLVPTIAIELEAKALMFGEKKYGRYNYTQGFETSRLLAAALRHTLAYRDGHDVDSESGIHHLGHARACFAMLLHCEQLGTMRDNRFRGKR